MRALIIEDELLAQDKLEAMLLQLEPTAVVAAKLGSVKATIEWLRKNPAPDLAFVDIQLSDDHSFEIFRQQQVQFPVIFTTAFDKYLLESFEFNSIDYLLKPITETQLKRALTKVKNLQAHFTNNIQQLIGRTGKRTLDRIVVRKGMEFITVSAEKFAFFYTEHRIVFLRDVSGHQYIVDKTLTELESQLDERNFFRINRKYISSLAAIEKFRSDNGKIRVFLKPEMKEEIHVSKETAPAFRKWIGARD